MGFNHKNGKEIYGILKLEDEQNFEKIYNEFCDWMNDFWKTNEVETELFKSGFYVFDFNIKYEHNSYESYAKPFDYRDNTYVSYDTILEDKTIIPYVVYEGLNIHKKFQNIVLWKRFSSEYHFDFELLLRGNLCSNSHIYKFKKCMYSFKIIPIY